ncbi:MAG TPA: 6-aminohexanoate hydrolase, partial [Caulobacter sp.]|nr:6-aminohexanoate hydrolase [Caulobacter sp.]
SHSVRDSAAMFGASERTAAGSPFKAIGVVTKPLKKRLKVGLLLETGMGQKPDAEVVAAIEGAAKLMASLGHRVEPTS